MSHRRPGRRDREYRTRKIVFRAEWHYGGRLAVLVEVTRQGELLLTVPHPERVGSVGREIAADWLREYAPRLTHDERFSTLWERSA